jgi:hypothetical protein
MQPCHWGSGFGLHGCTCKSLKTHSYCCRPHEVLRVTVTAPRAHSYSPGKSLWAAGWGGEGASMQIAGAPGPPKAWKLGVGRPNAICRCPFASQNMSAVRSLVFLVNLFAFQNWDGKRRPNAVCRCLRPPKRFRCPSSCVLQMIRHTKDVPGVRAPQCNLPVPLASLRLGVDFGNLGRPNAVCQCPMSPKCLPASECHATFISTCMHA